MDNPVFLYSKVDDAWCTTYINKKGDRRWVGIFSLAADHGIEVTVDDPVWFWIDQDVETGELQILGKEDTTFQEATIAATACINQNKE